MAYYKRSPFLFSSWTEGDKMILHNYNEYSKVLISKEVMKVVNMLSSWTTLQEISDKLQINKKSAAGILQQLTKLHIIDKIGPNRKKTEIYSKFWDPFDLAVQRQKSFGGSFPITSRI